MPTALDLRAAGGVLTILSRVGVASTLNSESTVVDPVSGTAVTTTASFPVLAFLYMVEVENSRPNGPIRGTEARIIIPRTATGGEVIPDINLGSEIVYGPVTAQLRENYRITDIEPIATGEQAAGYILSVETV